MIQYALKCDEGHSFDSWFKSAEAFEKLSSSQMITCPVCGSISIKKSVMAPQVCTTRTTVATSEQPKAPLSATETKYEQALKELKTYIEKKSHYVGREFISEARAMHQGDVPERSIHGEARADEARELIEDGIPVAPLPFMPTRKTN